MNIGIFGGTFNPVHFGHLRTVEEIREGFNLEIIYFVVAKIPPHKNSENIASASERYRLLKIAIKNNPFFKPSSIELRRKKTSYSFDTIMYFKKKFKDDNLYFIMGADAFKEIYTWFKYKEILKNIDIIVMARPEYNCDYELLERLGYKKCEKRVFVNSYCKKVFFYNVTQLDISSSKIRDYIGKNLSVNYFLPEKCIKYIYKNKLYK